MQIKLAPNVLNLPLRPPAVVARAAASLDRLSGGRVELGLGAGAFGDAVAAMGGPRRTPGEAVEALDEAITILRELWDTTTRGGVRLAGRHYVVDGAKRGPAPLHPIGIWLGAYKPRMLRLTGRRADGWLPSMGYLGPDALAEANAIIDQAALDAGREPADVRRIYNISGSFGRGGGFLQGPPEQWVEQLTALSIEHGMATYILGSDDPEMITTFAREVAPAVREAVADRRSRGEVDGCPRSVPLLLRRPRADGPDRRLHRGADAGRRHPAQPESLVGREFPADRPGPGHPPPLHRGRARLVPAADRHP